MREAIPLASRMWTWFQTTCRSRIPQLDREQRIELVDRLETNSTFDFDFVALISLSTIIAALGLIRNSAAVVIGAMLVAPLMTPLVGMGFALIQANEKLIWSTMRSVLFGFAVAFMTSVILGAAIPKSWWNDVTVAAPVVESEVMLNAELASRCKPHLLDLVVALVSGVAGAYATGRPNLIGALPGVAIAAALVPPIATSGILFAIGEFELSRNAFLLFFTNIVAIVLGTTFAFWGIGINAPATKPKDGEGRQPPVLPRYIFFMLVILAFALAIWFAIDELPDVTHSFFGSVD